MTDQITFTMATIPERIKSLQVVTKSILPQCDELWIYMNGYHTVPDFLRSPKIRIFKSKSFGECGDIGKFHDSDKIEGYHFTVDDDIIYPPNYAQRMIKAIEHYKRMAVVAVHGAKVHFPCQNYYRHRRHYHFRRQLDNDQFVNVVGTGTVAFHTSTINISRDDFIVPNMADIYFAIAAQKQEVPLVLVQRGNGWLRPCHHASMLGSIYDKSKNKEHGTFQTQTLNQHYKEYGFPVLKIKGII